MNDLYKYEEICVKIHNQQELFKIMDILNNSNKPPENDIDGIYEFLPNYLFIRLFYNKTRLTYLTDEDIYNQQSINLLDQVLHEEDTDPKIYYMDDFNRIKNVLNTGYNFMEPSYEPKKKIERTLENSNNSNSKYRFKTENEFIKEFGENWRNRLDWRMDNKMDYLFGQIYPHVVYPNQLKQEPLEISDEMKLKLEIDRYRWIIRTNMLKLLEPSYKPKLKPKRILENIKNDYPYRFKTEDEFIKEFGENWRYNSQYCIFSDRMDELFGKPYPFYISTNDLDYLSSIILSDNFYRCTIEKWMLTKNEPKKPSYEPKIKPKRLLENLNKNILKKGKYKVIGIFIKNIHENNIFKDIILNIKGINVPNLGIPICYVLFTEQIGGFREDAIYTAGDTPHYINDGFYKDRGINLGLSKNDISPAFNIDEFQRYINNINKPTYEPKKRPERLLESINYPSLILSPYQQRNMFKIGGIFKIREDAFNYFTDRTKHMEKYLGKKVKITEINTLKQKYGDEIFNSYITYPYKKDANIDDLIITVEKAEDINDDAKWYWYYRCFEYAPTYEPKKRIDRTL